MRVLTVSEMKENGLSRTFRDWPAEGSMARAIYERLAAQKGHAVDLGRLGLHKKGCRGRDIDRLRDDYGCDIRHIRQNVYILAGEWFGAHYSDYVAQALHDAERAA